MMSPISLCEIYFSARTRSAVELATCVARRSKVRAWPSSTAPMNMADMIGTIGLGDHIELFLVIADDD